MNPHKNRILIPHELIKIPQEPLWAVSHDLQPRSCHLGLFAQLATLHCNGYHVEVEFPLPNLLIPQELIKIPQEAPWAVSHDLQPRSSDNYEAFDYAITYTCPMNLFFRKHLF